MALSVLNVNGDCNLRAVIKDGTSGGVINKTFGRVSVPALSVSLAFGTGSGQANKLYIASRALAATTFDLLDLAGGLSDGLGNTLTFTSLKLAVLAILTPNGTKVLRVGPQAQSNPFLGAWGGTGATVYKGFTHWDMPVYDPVAGYAVTAGTGDILPIYNPTGSSITYTILLAGV